MPENHYDVIVIGAGIAGASVAAELAASARVLVLEREEQPGYHTTGRSAALYTATYGPPVIRALTRASAGTLLGDHPQPLTRPRGLLFVARRDQVDALERMQAELGDAVTRLTPDAARAYLPLLREGHIHGALHDTGASDIDVDALHRMYLRRLGTANGVLMTNSEVQAITRDGADWLIRCGTGAFRAPRIVNAAGAWADEIAALAGVKPVGLVPKRRTAVIVAPPDGIDPAPFPMTVDVDETFYIKPEAGKLLLSPADATPSPACDARPEELDIAICVDRAQRALELPVRRIEHSWAGLRSFVADGCPVAGYAPEAPGFFWLAGQGGYGIQSAPALARAAAALLDDRPIPQDIAAESVTADALAPTRATLEA